MAKRGPKKQQVENESFVSRNELIQLRGLSLDFIKRELTPIMYNFGHKTKKYKLSEVDQFLAQKRVG